MYVVFRRLLLLLMPGCNKVWAIPESDNEHHWIKGHPISLLVHLHDCGLQSQLVRNQASEDYTHSTAPNSPRRRRHNLSLIMYDTPATLDPHAHSSPASSSASSPIDPVLLAVSQPLTPGPSALSINSNSQASLPVTLMCRHSHGGSVRCASSQVLATPLFNQTCFETLVTHLTASAGFPLNWVENPVWLIMCDEFHWGQRTLWNPLIYSLTSKWISFEV